MTCQASSDMRSRWKQGAKDYVGRSAEGILRGRQAVELWVHSTSVVMQRQQTSQVLPGASALFQPRQNRQRMSLCRSSLPLSITVLACAYPMQFLGNGARIWCKNIAQQRCPTTSMPLVHHLSLNPCTNWRAVAEGGAYGEDAAGGNSFSYWFLAVGFAGAAAFAAVAPSIVSICGLPVLAG